jgi:hypothetical protein
MSARADLCGGRSAMIVPTATSPTPGLVGICRLRQLAPGAQRVCQTRKSQQFGEETKLLCAYVDMPLQFVTVYDSMTEGSENG